MTTSSYLENFNSQVEMMEACRGTIGYNKGMAATQLSLMNLPRNFTTAAIDKVNEETDEARDLYLAVAFLSGSDVNRFGGLIETLENDYLRGDTHATQQM